MKNDDRIAARRNYRRVPIVVCARLCVSRQTAAASHSLRLHQRCIVLLNFVAPKKSPLSDRASRICLLSPHCCHTLLAMRAHIVFVVIIISLLGVIIGIIEWVLSYCTMLVYFCTDYKNVNIYLPYSLSPKTPIFNNRGEKFFVVCNCCCFVFYGVIVYIR